MSFLCTIALIGLENILAISKIHSKPAAPSPTEETGYRIAHRKNTRPLASTMQGSSVLCTRTVTIEPKFLVKVRRALWSACDFEVRVRFQLNPE